MSEHGYKTLPPDYKIGEEMKEPPGAFRTAWVLLWCLPLAVVWMLMYCLITIMYGLTTADKFVACWYSFVRN